MTEQQALGAFYYGAREYNLITFGDYTAAASDTWGAVAVGGVFRDLSDGITLGQEVSCLPKNSDRSSATDPVAIFRGGIELSKDVKPKTPNGTLAVSPSIQAAGSWNNATDYLNSSRFYPSNVQTDRYFECTKGLASWDLASSVVDFDSLYSRLSSAQSVFSAKGTSTSGVTKSIRSDGSDVKRSSIAVTAPGISYVDVNVGDYAGQILDLSIPEGSFLVINLHVGAAYGGNVFNPNGMTLGGVDWSSGQPVGTAANRVLWNVLFESSGSPSDNSLVIGVKDQDFFGSILAPTGGIDGSGSRVWGQIVSSAYTQSSNCEIHQALMQVNLTMVPEPSTIALGMGALAFGFVFWRRRQQRQHQQS